MRSTSRPLACSLPASSSRRWMWKRKARARYGKGDPKNRDDGGPKLMEHFLVARRLVEAGARCVTLAFSRWDHHGDNFGALRQDLPLFDQGLSALVEDLHQRGLDQDVSVV